MSETVRRRLTSALENNVEQYRVAAQNAIDDAVEKLLRARIERRERYMEDLTGGVEPAGTGSDLTAGLRRGWTTFKASFAGWEEADEIALRQCQKADSDLLDAYRAALDELEGGNETIAEQYGRLQAEYAFLGARLSDDANPVVLALFADRDSVNDALSDLLGRDDITEEDVHVMARKDVVSEFLRDNRAQSAQETAGAAALTGAAYGGLIGLVAGISGVAVPAIGLGTAIGALGVTATGAGIGALYTGVFGALLGWGIGEEDTHLYLESIRRGEVLLAVSTTSEQSEPIEEILQAHNGHSISHRYAVSEEAEA